MGVVLGRCEHLWVVAEPVNQHLALGALERPDADPQPRIDVVNGAIEPAPQGSHRRRAITPAA